MAIISAKEVCFSYNKQKNNISNLSLEIEKGEYIAIVGHNGSGKSTIAKLLNALLIPDSGELEIFGFSPKDKQSLFEIRKRVGVVFQNPDNQLVASIVEDDIAFGPENLGVKREEIKERIEFALQATQMQDYRHSSTERLSGGQKQRIAVAGVLALKPEVLILDESTAMLDPIGRKEILDVAKKLNKENGTTIIAITHYMEEVFVADRVVVVKNGAVARIDTSSGLFAGEIDLKEYGLELPYVTQIGQALKEKGLNIKSGILTEDELVEELCKLK